MLSNSGESEHPCLVPDLSRNALFFTIDNNVCCRLVIYGLYYVEVHSFVPSMLRVFSYHERMLSFVTLFLYLLIIIGFLFCDCVVSPLLICKLSHLYIPE